MAKQKATPEEKAKLKERKKAEKSKHEYAAKMVRNDRTPFKR